MARQKKKSKSPGNKRRSAREKSKSTRDEPRLNSTNTTATTTSRVSAFGSTLVHLGIIWAVCTGLALLARAHTTTNNNNSAFVVVDGYRIPQETLQGWTEYPNPLNITNADRATFSPVVKFPKLWIETNDTKKKEQVENYRILDMTISSASAQLASPDECKLAAAGKQKERRVEPLKDYAVGRYDENRVHLYQSELFDDTTNAINGFAGARTVHIGIDLDGPLGTKVHAFTNGIVHSAGYNADLGDYGNVIVIEHDLGKGFNGEQPRKVYALYGHLDNKSIKGMKPGKKIKKGQVIGRFGDVHENGGWFMPHVHFQLSIHPPDAHDMPGAVSVEDRPRALIHYPDPRQVLGPLY